MHLWRSWTLVGIWIGILNSGRYGRTTKRHSIGCPICAYACARKRRGIHCYTRINLVLPFPKPFKNPRHPMCPSSHREVTAIHSRSSNGPKWNKSMAVLRLTDQLHGWIMLVIALPPSSPNSILTSYSVATKSSVLR